MRSIILPILLINSAALAATDSAPTPSDVFDEIAVVMPSYDITTHIVNGQLVEAAAEQFETVAMLTCGPNTGAPSSSQGFTCTGSLVDENWFLTAAHCVWNDDAPGSPNGAAEDPCGSGSRLMVMWGNSPANGDIDDYRVVDWDNSFVHETYIPLERLPQAAIADDIALMKLDQPKNDVGFMGVNDQEFDNTTIGENTTHVGYGLTSHEGTGSGTKRWTDDKPSRIIDYNDVQFLVFNEGISGICQGDSGGPALFEQAGSYVQVGITSFGSSTTCKDAPAGFMRVDSYISWLEGLETDPPLVLTKEFTGSPRLVCEDTIGSGVGAFVDAGAVDATVNCEVLYPPGTELLDGVTWSWGDGETSEGLEVSHTYTSEGYFNVEMCATFNEGQTTKCDNKPNFIRACDIPNPTFTYELLGGLDVQFLNNTNLATYQCIDAIEWKVFKGEGTSGDPIASIRTWEPKYTFEEKGTYTIQLNVGGQAGWNAAEITAEFKPERAGCDSSGAAGGMSLLLGLFGAAVMRRRRD